MNIKTVGIISKPKKPEIKEIVPPLVEWLRARNIETLVDRETGTILDSYDRCLSRNEMPARVELFVVLGGDGTLLATGTPDDFQAIVVWDLASGQSTQIINGHNRDVRSVSFSPDDSTIATASWDGSVLLWSVES